MAPSITISDLSDVPEFAGDVADRVWNAWWREAGVRLPDLRARVDEALAGDGIPIALVAHEGKTFLGTASLIACDMEMRAQYSPWVAAVWVEPEYRGAGIGAALVGAAAMTAFDLGAERAYLCATAANAPFYSRLGWQVIEVDVDGLDILVMERPITAG
jgi:GNAT superfamily N-acetyltransferase